MFNRYSDVVSVNDVAQMLGVGKNTAYDLVRSGAIRSIRCGRKYLVPKANVIAFLCADQLIPLPDDDIMDATYGLVIDKEVVAQ